VAQVPLGCHVPVDEQVWVSVPQSPQGTGLVCPGAHVPVHAPPVHVWFVQATGCPHWPFVPHVCTPLPEHCTWFGVQTPEQAPLEHMPLAHATGLPHAPDTHVCTAPPAQRVCPLAHAPVSAPPESVPPSPCGVPRSAAVSAVDESPVAVSTDASCGAASSMSSMPARVAQPATAPPIVTIAMPMRAPLRMRPS
jgi:hypothetical protein